MIKINLWNNKNKFVKRLLKNYYMSCFDIDFITGVANKNETNHFHIVLNGNYDICISENGELDTKNLSQKEYGVLLHEYIHYIQHLLTLFGICRCKMFNLCFLKLLQYIHSLDTITLPIKLSKIDNRIENYENSLRKTLGTKYYSSHNVDAVEVSDSMLKLAKANNSSVKIGVYDYINDEAIDNEIDFGYWGIIESMAHMIQRKVDSSINSSHNAVPYRMVELICANKYPSLCDDENMMISLCICALMFDNPGAAFFDVADYAIKYRIENGRELYSYVLDNFSINYKDETLPLKKAMPLFLDELLSSIKGIIGIKVNYLYLVAQSCKDEAECCQSFLLDLLYDNHINFAKDSMNMLIKKYGLPLIQANNLIIMPNSSKKYTLPYCETARLLGVEILYKRIVSTNAKCPWYSVCSMSQDLSEEEKNSLNTDMTSYECLCDQWNKSQTCLMTQAINFYQLDTKTFVQK
ncbi:MAG: hypothetical protein J5658_07955 [Prevotella sp.]|nr:hypothetical protein [Prevotella sp.]